MSSENAIRIENLGKCYQMYSQPHHRLLQIFRKKIYYKEHWAVQDVSFAVPRGSAVGLIGRNGSGKSTLLQMVSGNLEPTTGRYHVAGRLTALLELGAGFDPNFSGRENAEMALALQGAPIEQHAELLAAIEQFADIGKFFEEAVKTYSSGMFVRLAFAANTVLNPDILVIDEALSVGDSIFQLKCFNRMRELQASGSTILLVSHDLQTIRSFCDQAVWLHQGKMMAYGDTAKVTSEYAKFAFDERFAASRPVEHSPSAQLKPGDGRGNNQPSVDLVDRTGKDSFGTGEYRITGVSVNRIAGGGEAILEHGARLRIAVHARCITPDPSDLLGVSIALLTPTTQNVICIGSFDEGVRPESLRPDDELIAEFEFDNILAPGRYLLAIALEDNKGQDLHYYDFIRDALQLTVVSPKKIHSTVQPRAEVRLSVLDGGLTDENHA
jgi:lipopolysaccharide transport system ATP-binding protein